MEIKSTFKIWEEATEFNPELSAEENFKKGLNIIDEKKEDMWVKVEDVVHFLQKGANADWEAEILEREVLKHNVSCNNICNIARDLRYKLKKLFDELGGHI